MAAQCFLTCKDLALVIIGWRSSPLEAGAETKARVRFVLENSFSAKIYLPQLEARLPLLERQYEGQPETLGEAMTLLRETQARLDGYERAVERVCLLYEEAPDVEEPRRLSAQKVRESLVPDRRRRSYADEAAQAPVHAEAVTRLSEDLDRVGPDARRWALAQVAEETRLAQLLDTRETVASGVITGTSTLRGEVLSLMNEFRTSLKRELAINPELPPEAESLVFSAFDRYAQRRS